MKYRFMLLAALSMFIPSLAFAQLGSPVAEPASYSVLLNHPASQPAAMRLQANDNVKDIDILINNCAVKPVRQHINSIPRGSSFDVNWSQPAGQYNCSVQIQGKDSAGNKWKINNSFQMASVESLGVSTDIKGLSADINDLTWHATHPVTKASLTITAEDGSEIDSINLDLNPPKKDMQMTWKKSSKTPAIVELRLDDANGVWSTNTIVSISIPHEDVVFDTGKSTIRKDQEHKLIETMNNINEVRSRYERIVTSLYITGYTDTVGSIESNDKLSRERAQSIASWMKKHGFSNIDTYYRGLGERVLYTKTADETPEESNRRVTYVLSNVAPTDFTNIPAGQWKKI